SCRARGAGSHARVIDPGPAFRSHRPEAWRCSMAFRGAWAGLVMATLAAAGCGDDAVGAGPADVVGDVPAGEVGVDAAPPPEVREPAPDGAPDGAGAAAPEVDEGPCPAPTGARPPLLGEHAGAHDPARDRVVVFGGNAAVPVSCGSP